MFSIDCKLTETELQMPKITILNLDHCPSSGRFYGGRAGRKEGILIDGEPWIVKYPRSTKDLKGKRLPSYTSSPVCEYIGSKIYEMLGIDVHEVKLGYRNGKIVAACRDFAVNGWQLVEFNKLKNTISDDEDSFSSRPSDGEARALFDVLATLSLVPQLRDTPGVRDRFWDMFVVDALIKNPDRNNGNWGLLISENGNTKLAPVYDLGSCLFPRRTDSASKERLADKSLIYEDAIGTNISCYIAKGKDGELHHVKPLEYLASVEDLEPRMAVERALQRFDKEKLKQILCEIPADAFGQTVLSDIKKEQAFQIICTIYDEGFVKLKEKYALEEQ